MEPHIVLSEELGSQQKADVVKTDYSDNLLMITRLQMYVLVRLSYVLGIFVEHVRCVLCILVECSSNWEHSENVQRSCLLSV